MQLEDVSFLFFCFFLVKFIASIAKSFGRSSRESKTSSFPFFQSSHKITDSHQSHFDEPI